MRMEVTEYEVLGSLPDLFTFHDGRKVKTTTDWEERRLELYKSAIELQYGQIPPEPEFLEVDLLSNFPVSGMFNVYRVVTGRRECPVSFTMYCHFPAGTGPFPVVIDGDMCFPPMQNRDVAETLTSKGIMLVAFNRCEIVPDINNAPTARTLYETYPELTFGAVAAWAWGFSRTLDALIKLGLADLSSVTFTGWSRGGKTALLAGALDSRATIVSPEGSGAGGSSCYRIHMKAIEEDGVERRDEHLADLIRAFPYWFSPALREYVDREVALPFDQHFLKALIAPRIYFDSQAMSDVWAGPVNTLMSTMAAREVWKMYGKEENVLWYWRPGKHDHTPEDFEMLTEVILHEKNGVPLSDKFMNVPFDIPERIYTTYDPLSE